MKSWTTDSGLGREPEIHRCRQHGPCISRAEPATPGGEARAADADAAMALIDPVWGGVIPIFRSRLLGHPHFEKIMSFQAQYLRAIQPGLCAVEGSRYLAAARDIDAISLSSS